MKISNEVVLLGMSLQALSRQRDPKSRKGSTYSLKSLLGEWTFDRLRGNPESIGNGRKEKTKSDNLKLEHGDMSFMAYRGDELSKRRCEK